MPTNIMCSLKGDIELFFITIRIFYFNSSFIYLFAFDEQLLTNVHWNMGRRGGLQHLILNHFWNIVVL